MELVLMEEFGFRPLRSGIFFYAWAVTDDNEKLQQDVSVPCDRGYFFTLVLQLTQIFI